MDEKINMGKIFCVMGKSASGKDTIYQRILENKELGLRRVIPYTTRPIRAGEAEGEQYFFCTEEKVQELEEAGKIVELRAYDTVYGIWKYFTVDDGNINLEQEDYIVIGTLESYGKIRQYFGEEKVFPIYVEVEDGERLLRAIAREKMQEVPKYEEMCRRFLADAADFSEKHLEELGINHRFNNVDLNSTIEEIIQYIHKVR